nr:porin family protein [uncultured Psychroserpens sp.]
MKKLLTIVLFASLCVINLNAQSSKGDIEFGPGLGFNYASVVVGSGAENTTDTNTGFNISATGEYFFSDRWGIKAKLIYDQKGWGNGFFEDDNGSFTTDYNLNYLTIPVMANWHFGSTRKWYLNFGPYLGVLLNAKEDRLGIDVKEAFNTTDVGLAFGIGYKFPIGENAKLYIEYDEQYGFIDIFKDNIGNSVINSRGSFNVGVLFNL